MVVEVAPDDVGRRPVHQIPGVDPVVLTEVEVEQCCLLLIGDPGPPGPKSITLTAPTRQRCSSEARRRRTSSSGISIIDFARSNTFRIAGAPSASVISRAKATP
jgi:hypothetical protein